MFYSAIPHPIPGFINLVCTTVRHTLDPIGMIQYHFMAVNSILLLLYLMYYGCGLVKKNKNNDKKLVNVVKQIGYSLIDNPGGKPTI